MARPTTFNKNLATRKSNGKPLSKRENGGK